MMLVPFALDGVNWGHLRFVSYYHEGTLFWVSFVCLFSLMSFDFGADFAGSENFSDCIELVLLVWFFVDSMFRHFIFQKIVFVESLSYLMQRTILAQLLRFFYL
ncbi:hypothetical protein LguiB_016284 [Lonicera macranthoides]